MSADDIKNVTLPVFVTVYATKSCFFILAGTFFNKFKSNDQNTKVLARAHGLEEGGIL